MSETNSTLKCCNGVCKCDIKDMKEVKNEKYLQEIEKYLDKIRPYVCVRIILKTGTDKEVKKRM